MLTVYVRFQFLSFVLSDQLILDLLIQFLSIMVGLGNAVVLHRYCGGEPAWKGGPEIEVRLYEVVGGKHSWAEADMDTCDEIWRFFSKYLR